MSRRIVSETLNCPACGAKMPLTAKFCGKCGARLTKSGEHARHLKGIEWQRPQSKLIGMQVYDPDCLFIGTVKEIGIVPGEGTITLHVSIKNGNLVEIGWDDVETVGDVILLAKKLEIPQLAVSNARQAPVETTPVTTKPMAPLCPQCGKPGTWIPQYKRYYCYNCKKYI
jgi:sporulation protein YlmC with PRC-barrel domain/ribosomal protein L40E